MAQYYRVSPNFWKGRRSWTDREKLLAQYLLSCPHRNLEGLYWLPLAYAQADLGWPAKAVEDAMATLQRDQYAAYDPDAQVLFLRKALKYQAPSTEKQVIGAISSLERVPETTLWSEFLTACRAWAPKLAEEIDKQSESDPNRIPIPFAGAAQSDPDIARTPISNSSSSSNSSQIPPLTPPKGGRKRDQDRHKDEMEAWAREQFPGLSVKAVVGYATMAVAAGASTPEAIRDFVLHHTGGVIAA